MNLGDNPNLSKNVEKDTLLKKWLVNYVGEDFKKELEEEQKLLLEDDKPREWDGSVTVEMIVDKVSKEFPEFLMVVAEENWIRGYREKKGC